MDSQFLNSDIVTKKIDNSSRTNDNFAMYSIPEKKIPAHFLENAQHQNVQVIREGQLFGRYMIQGELGRGGMGVVYKAMDTQLKRTVALKVILKGNSNDIKRFIRESSAMAQLEHNNIVKLYEFGTTPQPFFTMEYIEGFTLADLIKEKKVKPLFLLDLMIKVCDALAHAHKNNILHRDIKPSNIIITNKGEPKVMDFGVAKISNTTEKSLSKTGDVLGTILYMAPEHIDGKASEKSDIYSLGATIYESLTYRNVFQGDSHYNILFQILHNDPIPPRELNPNISPYFEAVCLKCMAKKEDKRYENFKQLTRELRNLKNHKPIIAKTYNTFDVFHSFVAKHKLFFALVAFFMVVLLAFSFFLLVAWRNTHQARLVAEKTTQRIQQEKARTKDTLNKVMDVLKYSTTEYPSLQKDKKFAQLFSRIFKDVEKYEGEENWNFIKGYIKSIEGDQQKSLEYFSKQIQKTPGSFLAYYNRGLHYQDLKQYKKALADYNKAVAIQPNDYQVLNNRGLVYLQQKHYDKALLDFNKVLSIKPDYTPAYNNRGLIFLQQQNYDKALVNFNKAIAINPNYNNAHSNNNAYNHRGIVYLQQKRYDKALADFDKAIAINPNFSDAYYNRGFIYLQQKKYGKALLNFNKAIAINPNFFDAYYNRGFFYMQQKIYDKALLDFNKTIAIDPYDFESYEQRGNIYQKLKLYDKALRDFNNAIAINSNSSRTYYNRANLYREQEQYDNAIADYNKAIAIDAKNLDAYYNCGSLYLKLEKYELAITYLQKVTSASPNIWQPYHKIHLCYKAMGQNKKAQYYLQQANKLKKSQ
ncbi:serine/threonine-protein kinase [Candidatus Uabimicrobium amorphum]|uniref:Serine/threonine protein kinase n=1 Tax=Uabimicrobium amorphum TaxID=2596890 RepID=A0A5S9IKT6_UABAM|nr:serine/threonine-protein kinase [Candidatus Uabimicrobium amorphum]BBM83380.1 serine/threonine protein kinase [Candidatus Uabimicrobium amorphum]